MRGSVTADGREAVMWVEVSSASGSETLRVKAVIDTGFTGHLTLPPAAVQSLSLPVVGSAESVLADGSLILEDICIARILWHGRERPIRVLIADAIPLLGMALLRGSDMSVRVEGNGEVPIEELSG